MLAGWVLLLVLLLPLLNTLNHLTSVDLWFWMVSLVVCLVVFILLKMQAPLALVNRVLLTSISIWTFSRLLLDVMFLASVRPATLVMIDALVALAFGFLSRAQAVVFTVFSSLALLLGGLSQVGADWEFLIFNLFTLAVIGFMSVYGQDVRAARVRAEHVETLLALDEETGLYTSQAAEVLIEVMVDQAVQRQQPFGLMVIRPRNLPWVETPGVLRPPQPAFALLAKRLKGICGPHDVVALWGERSLVVGVRHVDAAQLETRAQALRRALNGAYWLAGPMIQVDVTATVISSTERLEMELEALKRPLSVK